MDWFDYPAHWIFAFTAARSELERLVWNFQTVNEEVERRGHAFAGVREPEDLISIIDGFLDEFVDLPAGDVGQLKKMRAYLQENLVVAYQAGKASAAQKWLDVSPEERAKLADFDFPFDFRDEAKRSAPESYSATEQGWFVEGFARAWQDTRMEYNRALYERSKGERG